MKKNEEIRGGRGKRKNNSFTQTRDYQREKGGEWTEAGIGGDKW